MGKVAALLAGASDLTSSPWDDFEKNSSWVELAELHVETGVSAFWHCIEAWTYERHFNRNVWRIDTLEQEVCHRGGTPLAEPAESTVLSVNQDDITKVDGIDPSGEPDISNATGPPPDGKRRIVVRELQRKSPAPIGGGHDGRGQSFSVLEWTAQYVSEESNCHTAVFALVVPETAREDNNPRALTFWPFQYPKVAALRVSFECDQSDLDPTFCEGAECQNGSAEKHSMHGGGVLRYSVLPLHTGTDVACRDFNTIKIYACKAANQLLNEVRKRASRFDPVTGLSTYVKRVEHDKFVPEVLYRSHFRRLKEKYGHRWVADWPEVTDPVKFVYEELSIAAYLLALFEIERAPGAAKQSFVDLGCGNGFLTYVLLEEGFPGFGVDRQRRGIWDKYPAHVGARLKLESIDPTTYTCPGIDWIIGNHSDELTPFLPVICARSQKDSHAWKSGTRETLQPQFFVIPCCFFDFDERKYAAGFKRRTFAVADNGQGRYAMYLSYIERIAVGLGFAVGRENLRIPSTKYVALLGRTLEFPERATTDAVSATLAVAMEDARRSHAK